MAHFIDNRDEMKCPPDGQGEHVDLTRQACPLKYYYGGLFKTMASLYWAVSGGEDWSQVLEPLYALPLGYVLVFYVFITFSMFAMLNVVTSVFVDSTMQRSQNDREFVVQCELQGKQDFMETMEQVFEELDE